MANVSMSCRRIMEFFRKMCEKGNQGTLSNHIFSMYEILKASFEDLLLLSFPLLILEHIFAVPQVERHAVPGVGIVQHRNFPGLRRIPPGRNGLIPRS